MKEEKLYHLLTKKRGFFEAILELSETESSLPLREWISILEQKKILLSCIEEIDQELVHYQQALHILSQDITEELEKIREVIERIMHIDHQNQERRKKDYRI